MNEALDNALKAQGIVTPRDRRKFALEIGTTERSLDRWRMDGITPHRPVQQYVARKLKRKPEDLWPEEQAA